MHAKITAENLQALLQLPINSNRQVVGQTLHAGELAAGRLILLVKQDFWCEGYAEMLDGIR